MLQKARKKLSWKPKIYSSIIDEMISEEVKILDNE